MTVAVGYGSIPAVPFSPLGNSVIVEDQLDIQLEFAKSFPGLLAQANGMPPRSRGSYGVALILKRLLQSFIFPC